MADKFPLSPYFREYLYDVLFNMSPEQRARLKGKYHRIGRTNYFAKRFCDTAKLDEIMYVLSILNVNWFLVFFNHKNDERFISNIFEKSKDGDRNAELKLIVERQLYVSSSKQLFQILNSYSQSIQTGVYVNHLELSKAGVHARGWTKKADSKNIKEGYESLQTLNYITETIVNAATSCRRADISENQIWILVFMYRFAHTFIPYEKLMQRFEGIIQARNISWAVTQLKNSKYIDKHSKEKSYTITSLGVSEVHKIVNSVLKENSF